MNLEERLPLYVPPIEDVKDEIERWEKEKKDKELDRGVTIYDITDGYKIVNEEEND